METPIEIFENEGNVLRNYNSVVYMKYICEICNHIYDEEAGEPQSGLMPGCRWKDVPADWRCPDCSANKHSFKILEQV